MVSRLGVSSRETQRPRVHNAETSLPFGVAWRVNICYNGAPHDNAHGCPLPIHA